MTDRRHAHRYASPTLTGGDERPTPACQDAHEAWKQRRSEGDRTPWVYDVLMDHISGSEFDRAQRKARDICGSCRLVATCLKENREEQWAKAVMGQELRKSPKTREFCGSAKGMKYHASNGEHACEKCRLWNRQRVAQYAGTKRVTVRKATLTRADELRHLVNNGAGIDEACDALGVQRPSLQVWCGRHGLSHLYRALCASSTLQPNQWTREELEQRHATHALPVSRHSYTGTANKRGAA